MLIHNLLNNPLSTLPYFLLIAALFSLWISAHLAVWISIGSAAVIAALVAHRIEPIGAAFLGIVGLFCFLFYSSKPKSLQRSLLGLAFLGLALGLGFHKIPGFHNWLVVPSTVLTPGSTPYRLFLNFDKPFIGLFLIGFGMVRIRTLKQWKELLRTTLPVLAATVAILLGISLVFGFVRVELKWFEFSWIWLLVNLFLTVVPEEAFFRGFLQKELASILPGKERVAWIAVSVLFGLTHLPGGWLYACFATVAGLLYGLTYIKTRRIEACVLVHFAVNAIHFVAFTYPALAIRAG